MFYKETLLTHSVEGLLRLTRLLQSVLTHRTCAHSMLCCFTWTCYPARLAALPSSCRNNEGNHLDFKVIYAPAITSAHQTFVQFTPVYAASRFTFAKFLNIESWILSLSLQQNSSMLSSVFKICLGTTRF